MFLEQKKVKPNLTDNQRQQLQMIVESKVTQKMNRKQNLITHEFKRNYTRHQ